MLLTGMRLMIDMFEAEEEREDPVEGGNPIGGEPGAASLLGGEGGGSGQAGEEEPAGSRHSKIIIGCIVARAWARLIGILPASGPDVAMSVDAAGRHAHAAM
ncbi:MAG: hypothetical protein LAQ30_09265 [Acidobacteriia bacterium]|nr:hypothetical protein [Terriglobia bacterium]